MEDSLAQLKSLQAESHPFCVVCSGSNPYGLALKVEGFSGGVLTASFHPNPGLEGYEGRLHGGITASVLDGMMTNCLFAQGVRAVTAELRVRYREPVLVGPEISLRAWIERRHAPLFLLGAELVQENCIKAIATAKFMEHHG